MFALKKYSRVMFDGKIDAKFEGKPMCASQNYMRNLANSHRLKNSGFILENKMVELSQNKNLKQLD